MSRETDTPSSGPDGRGGAAYPSGTPPYGTPMASDDRTEAGRSAAQPEDRKTETTLTTRIRVNIPGSRPAPPIVVRKPVADAETTRDDSGADTRPAPAAEKPAAVPAEPAAEPAQPQAEEKTSDWFAPRKSGAPKGGTGGGTNGSGMPGGSAAAPAPAPPAVTGGAAPAPLPKRPAASGAAGGNGARPGGVVGSMAAPTGSSRPGGTNGAGLPGGATGGPVAPGHGGGTGSFDVTEALAAGPLSGSRPGADGGEPSRDDLPYFSDNAGRPGFGNGGAGANGPAGRGPGGPSGPSGFNGPNGPGVPGPNGPAGPTGGPVTGDGPFAAAAGPGEPFTGPAVAFPAPGARAGGATLAPGGGFSDDTAVLTPQKPAPEPGTPGYRAPDNVSGHTVTSGMPKVPGAGATPFASGGPGAPAPATPAPAPQPKAAAKPKKKGRSKLVLLAVAVVVIAGGAYGAGLLMNHTDVPNGTTVLGLDIGGGTRDEAVKKLDDTFGSRVNKPLKLSVDGKTVTITPDNAGLQFDFQATVSEAAKSDYNPVSVVGSLFGQKREIAPVMPIDEEKLQAALQHAGGGAGSVTDGGITFAAGKATPVYGKAGKGVDAAQASQAVERAYRTVVETGTATPVAVPTATSQPTVPNAEVDREMKEFAQPAMSGKVIVQTDAAHSIPLSPQNSLWKFLRVKAVDGKLVDSPDLNALKALYGQTFDGVLITRGTGKKTPVTPQDVYVALRQALMSRTSRVAVIPTNPS
ncbi:hypothetical protein [Streptomyces sp. NPDC005573]|uniref:hypothetical protein n=1 Tax=Streptomyces sp. NPDC005573 TaxID=3156890 RepID=UPI0033ABD518